MAEEARGNGQGELPPPAIPEGAQQLIVNAQYIKDLSFENPRAPQSLMQQTTQPSVDINVDVKAQNLAPDVFEVIRDPVHHLVTVTSKFLVIHLASVLFILPQREPFRNGTPVTHPATSRETIQGTPPAYAPLVRQEGEPHPSSVFVLLPLP